MVGSQTALLVAEGVGVYDLTGFVGISNQGDRRLGVGVAHVDLAVAIQILELASCKPKRNAVGSPDIGSLPRQAIRITLESQRCR